MEQTLDLGLEDSSLCRYLNGEFWNLKNKLCRALESPPIFQPRYDLSLDEIRALTNQRVRFAMSLPLVEHILQEQEQKTNFISRSLVLGEALCIVDVATCVKEQKYTGMFAMTEKGHGNNVREIQTQATFDLDNQLGLTIAIRYSHSWRQFGPKGKEEVKIIEHQMLTLRLMSHLATALTLTFTSRHAVFILDEDIFQGRDLINRRSLQALMAGLKAYSTWETVRCLQDCRECTGGMGCMENRVSGLKCDTDMFVTFEGDNVVILQAVARELLAQYNKQCKKNPVLGLIQNCSATAGDKLRTSFLAFNIDTVSPLTFLLKAVKFRERILQRSLVSGIYYKVVTKKGDFFSAWNSGMHHVTSLSLAHIHRVALEQFSLAARHCPDREDQALLTKFCLLSGTKLVFWERGWYLEHKYLTPRTSVRIRAQLLDLCESVKDDALKVASAFNIPHTNLYAPTQPRGCLGLPPRSHAAAGWGRGALPAVQAVSQAIPGVARNVVAVR